MDCSRSVSSASALFPTYCAKIDLLLGLLQRLARRSAFPRTLVFVNTKRQAESVAIRLIKEGFRALAIHGDLRLEQRHRVVDKFKAGRADLVVGTDVMARGLNIPHVDMVVNFDLPVARMEEYVHRVGRTGRLGNVGTAISFYDPFTDATVAPVVEKVGGEGRPTGAQIMTATGQPVPGYISDTIAYQMEKFMEQSVTVDRRACVEAGVLPPWRNIVSDEVLFE